jgi:hypothetical protein
MARLITLCLTFIVITAQLRAQCDDFSFYYVSGSVFIKQGSILTAAKKNLDLVPGSVLQIGNESSVILLTGPDRALRLSQQGNLTYANLQDICRKNQSSLTSQYVKYVAHTLIEKQESQTAMVIKGAVYRTRATFTNSLMRTPPDSSVIASDSVVFSWQQPPDNKPAFLLISENGVKSVYLSPVSGTTMVLPARIFREGMIYFWLISKSPTPSDNEPRFTFVLGTHNWQTIVLDEWARTMTELEQENQDVKKKLESKKRLY